MHVEAVDVQDLGLRAALEQHRLPIADLTGKSVFVFRSDREELVGYGGLELYGDNGLLRSVVTVERARGKGYGRRIVEWLCMHARAAGVRHLYLLTTDAAPFFEAVGFHTVERTAAPEAIAQTAQFTELCPASAVMMCRALN